ncbi:MAG: hypothetical protein KKD28_07920 [Chloroflexi bacterium]|nr:hypothetical protein [Chloroflexota bacterium]MBU1661385.1 hypothetical protein [Chloroflexota bacterium]
MNKRKWLKRGGTIMGVVLLIGMVAGTALAWEYPGDVNDNDRIDWIDVWLILNHAVGGAAVPADFRADLNYDGQVNVQDAVLLAGWLPEVTLTSPNDGITIMAGEAFTLTGSATSGYAINEYIWTSDSLGNLGSGVSVPIVAYDLGEHIITLTAVDAQLRASSASVRISINPPENALPLLSITWPPDGGKFQSGQPVILSGSGTDPEDGPLLPDKLAWESDLDGSLGVGTPFTMTGLSPGNHLISLQGTDDHGLTGQTAVQITVQDTGGTPLLTGESVAPEIFSPAQNPYQPTGSATATVAYTLTQTASVKVWVADEVGNTIRILAEGSTPPGSHTLPWDGLDDLGGYPPAGKYNIHIRAWDGPIPWERVISITIFY